MNDSTMLNPAKKFVCNGRILMVGFGSIGQGTLPLLLRHLDIAPQHIGIVTGDENGRNVAGEYGVEFVDSDRKSTRLNFSHT